MISVIIPTRNRADSLGRTLESLTCQNAPDAEFEVLVIDNGSTDHTKAVAQAFADKLPLAQLHYIFEPEPGLLSGRHRGAQAAKGEILSFLDDDVELDSGWLAAIQSAFEHQAVQLVGGRNLPRYESDPPEWLQYFWQRQDGGQLCTELSLLDLGSTRRIVDANYIWGLNFSIRKRALYELGGFHPDCIPKQLQHLQGDGETGLTRQANQRSYTALYEPLALLYHVVPAARLTPDYFESRYFYQGVCDSYTAIRDRHRGQDASEQSPELSNRLHHYIGKVKGKLASLIKGSDEYRAIRQRCKIAYANGFTFHQQRVARHPALLEWVLKDDYWDYQLPDIVVASQGDRAPTLSPPSSMAPSMLSQLKSTLAAPVAKIIQSTVTAAESTSSKCAQMQLWLQYRQLRCQPDALPDFGDTGFKVYSQADEDGLLLYIFALIGTTNKHCIDIAAGHPVGANSTNLIVNWGWHGLLIEGNPELVAASQQFYAKNSNTFIFPPQVVNAWVTAEGINGLIAQHGFEGEIDLLSLDIDGIDYWLLESLEVVKPRVMMVEYQDILGGDRALTVPYQPNFNRFDTHPDFYGASLPAFVKLAAQKGYRLVGCNQYGYNAFFVANGLGDDLLPEVSVQSCLTHPKVWQGQKERLPAVENLPWVEV
ncbi:glycosyltransferase [Nodosilinea sp. LEGE 07088]|uniref:glycosyltransferase family 2 protein n=1 Tax=Nodosilinea sp. LEGE 07088 TaxID=2777968 RepID=UPI00187E4527|nr:glycosyltransferase [Nodosilinea sp. LEGE 07088]MBE9138803.1 glycosyltransferase [Nodosilinea sp. LEGE 07088]